jgi:pimeloyl-ACP methyl ester carboxylesterase
VLIGGAFNDRSTMTALAALLAAGPVPLTTVQYDRRGRGDSGPLTGALTAPERLAMELADLRAVLEAVGGAAHLFGHSSGGVLALQAAAYGLPVVRVAVYEPSYRVSATGDLPAADLIDRVAAAVDADDRDLAVALFLTEAVGLPAEYLDGMRQDETTWGGMTALAHTLPNDLALHGPSQSISEHLGDIDCPTLVIDGALSPAWTRDTAAAVAGIVPQAQRLTLPGQDHSILWAPEPLVDPLSRFLS